MCGFLVNISFDNLSKAKVDEISQSIYKRGPDKRGHITYTTSSGRKVNMIHTRLEILGIGDNGSQPMQNENYILVFNGEIYNYKDLLLTLGLNYEDSGDTRLLLDHITKFGIKHTLKVIKGIYSFVVLDKTHQKLYLYRDCFGTKPLYIYKKDNIFTVGSNVKSISLVNNDSSIGELTDLGELFFLMFGFTFISKDTTKKISELDPGNLLEVNINNLKSKYIKLNDRGRKVDLGNNWKKEIKDSYNSDVPISILLSGGIDSVYIASLNREIQKKDITTFTISNVSGSNYLDVKKAKEIAKALNLANYQINLNENIIQKEIKNYISNMEYPTDDGLNIYLASKEIRKKKIKVCLTGLGGDEFFGGYSSSKTNILKFFLRKSFLWNYIPLFRDFILNNGFGGYLKLPKIDPSRISGYLYGKAFIFKNMSNNMIEKAISKFSRVLVQRLPKDFPDYFDYQSRISLLEIYGYCVPQLVKDTDTFAMANSVEIRPSLLINSFLESLITRKSYKERFFGKDFLINKMDSDISKKLNLSKNGFTIDLDKFLKENINQIYESIINYKNNFQYKMMIDEIKLLIIQNKKISNRKKYFLWRLYILSCWQSK